MANGKAKKQTKTVVTEIDPHQVYEWEEVTELLAKVWVKFLIGLVVGVAVLALAAGLAPVDYRFPVLAVTVALVFAALKNPFLEALSSIIFMVGNSKKLKERQDNPGWKSKSEDAAKQAKTAKQAKAAKPAKQGKAK